MAGQGLGSCASNSSIHRENDACSVGLTKKVHESILRYEYMLLSKHENGIWP